MRNRSSQHITWATTAASSERSYPILPGRGIYWAVRISRHLHQSRSTPGYVPPRTGQQPRPCCTGWAAVGRNSIAVGSDVALAEGRPGSGMPATSAAPGITAPHETGGRARCRHHPVTLTDLKPPPCRSPPSPPGRPCSGASLSRGRGRLLIIGGAGESVPIAIPARPPAHPAWR